METTKSENHSIIYLATDHTGLYEKYGNLYLETRKDYWNDDARIYYKLLIKQIDWKYKKNVQN